MFLDAVGDHPRCNINYDPVALPAAAARLSRLHRHLSRAHQGVPRQGRRVQPDRPAGRLFRLPALDQPRRPLPLARRRAGRFRRHLLQAGAVRLRRLGGAGMGMLPEASRGGRGEGAPFIASHIIRVTEKAFDDFAGGAADRKQTARMLGLNASGRSAMSAEDERPSKTTAQSSGRIRLGMVGGGEGAFIGAVHRIAARMDDHYELVAGALSSTPEKAQRSGAELGLDAGPHLSATSTRWRRPKRRAPGRHRGGRDRHAQPHALRRRPRPSSRPASTSSATSR